MIFTTTIYQDGKRIREVNHGYKEPTAEDLRTIDCTPDPDYIASKKTKIEKLQEEAQNRKREEEKEAERKKFEESKEGVNVNPLELSPKPTASQKIYREELDAIRNRAEDLEV